MFRYAISKKIPQRDILENASVPEKFFLNFLQNVLDDKKAWRLALLIKL